MSLPSGIENLFAGLPAQWAALTADTSTSILAAGGATVLLLGTFLLSGSKKNVPPGPKGLPIIGNALDMPAESPWTVYLDWSKQYKSDVISLRLPGRYLIILNSAKAVNDLLVKRSSIYSDRPQSTMFNKLMNLNWILGLMRYGDQWKEHRKHFRTEFEHRGSAIVRHHELHSARRLIYRLYKNESNVNYSRDLQLSTADTILSVTYGITPKSEEDYLITVAESLVRAMAEIAGAGYLVDMFPIFRHIPSWFPGASFKRKAKVWKQYGADARNIPFDLAKAEVVKGTAAPSVAAQFLNSGEAQDSHLEGVMRDILAEAYLGGAGATVGNLCSFILAMVMYPDVQKKAQAAIDAVTGGTRLPDFSDHEDIPYVDALVEETLRWHPSAPIGVFHAVNQDDVYNGYLIPKGSMISPNVYAISHDPELYGPLDVYEYIPERFLDKNGKRDRNIPDSDASFGLGRRICPGRGMGREILWITMASILAVYDLSDPVTADGKPLTLDKVEYSNSMSSRPQYFDCKFTRRSNIPESLILNAINETD